MADGCIDRTRALLDEVVRARADDKGLAWLEPSIAALSGRPAVSAVLNAYAGASRRMGKQALALSAAEQAQVQSLDEALHLERWGLDEAARALLLLHLAPEPADDYVDTARVCYDKGDSREQENWLRSLAVLPHGARFLLTAVDACRSNIIPVFEAIACENPYPWRHFPELNFNQLVLKALFNSIALERIVGLSERLNADLARMADDYVSEREAAGRAVPVDIWLVIAPYASTAGLERIYRYLEHENPAHRYWAAMGLGRAPDENSRKRLQARTAQEPEARVRDAIESALAARG